MAELPLVKKILNDGLRSDYYKKNVGGEGNMSPRAFKNFFATSRRKLEAAHAGGKSEADLRALMASLVERKASQPRV